MPMFRCAAGTNTLRAGEFRHSSSMSTSPLSDVSRPAMTRKSVVFPQPEGPRTAVNLPAGSSRFTPARAAEPSNALTKSLTRTRGMPPSDTHPKDSGPRQTYDGGSHRKCADILITAVVPDHHHQRAHHLIAVGIEQRRRAQFPEGGDEHQHRPARCRRAHEGPKNPS